MGSNLTVSKTRLPNLNKETCNHDLVSYISIYHLWDILRIHEREIRAWAFAFHDSDLDEDGNLKVKHVHVILRLYRKVRLSTVIHWFACTDESGQKINTRDICCTGRVQQAYEYLTHKNHPDKFQYDSSIVRVSNEADFVGIQSYNDDSLKQALFAILDEGICAEEAALRYGRDFIMHNERVFSLADRIRVDRARGIIPHPVKMRELQVCDLCDLSDIF